MLMSEKEFAATERSTIRRLPSRGSYDKAKVYEVLDQGILAHVGFNTSHGPVVIPMGYARRGDSIILHGSAKSRLLIELAQGADVCVTVTLLDGLVLARSTFHHSMNYRSVVVFGHSSPISKPSEKNAALEHLVEHLVPGRGADARGANEGELAATLVVEVPITDASLKMRTGPPVDELRDLKIDVWSGVLPLRFEAGKPVPDEHTTDDKPVPDYLRHYPAGRL
jgi:nitroimidazol reductase NimA-like FMN-containing flavoprotein (pyridoxamine 5'-phosphate oxidase superfamily)